MRSATFVALVLATALGGGSAGSAACSSGDRALVDAGEPVVVGDANGDAAPFECLTVAPSACPEPTPVYADVTPIIEERCFACHGGTTENWPLMTYPHVAAWYAEIRGAMLDCSMPPPDSGLTMTTAERQVLLDWIRCGYPAD